ncbi:Uncharacterised protein [Klebsiella pneumoniae]|nr:Uncharacterised protein [Klebsiella pneumoniae]
MNVWRHNQPTAHGRQPVDLLRLQHRARADKRLLAVSVDDLRNTFLPLRRVQRDFDRVETGVDNGANVSQRLVWRNTAQDSDKWKVSLPLHKRCSLFLSEMPYRPQPR